MRKAVLFLALLAVVTAGCGGGTVLPTGSTAPTRAPTMVPSPFPTATLPPTPTNTPEAAAVPVLEYPTARTVMDNGRGDFMDTRDWFFDWTDVPEAEAYELIVIHMGASVPVIQEKVSHSSYFENPVGGATGALTGWTWKVRAQVGGEWGPWSKMGFFDVEEVGQDPRLQLGDLCYQAELPVDRSSPVEPLPIGLSDGLEVHEYLLEKDSAIDHNLFEPVGTTREEVNALFAPRRGAELRFVAPVDQQPGNWPDESILRPVTFRGAELVATQYLSYNVTHHQYTGKVTLGEDVIFEIPQEQAMLDNHFRALDATQTDWYVEVGHTVTIEGGEYPLRCLLGDVFENGESMSARYGHREAFGFQLLNGKPFYFFNQSGNIGFSYDGKATWLGVDEIPRYAEEYGPFSFIDPEHWENAVAFFARRGDNWYYVEIGKARRYRRSWITRITSPLAPNPLSALLLPFRDQIAVHREHHPGGQSDGKQGLQAVRTLHTRADL